MAIACWHMLSEMIVDGPIVPGSQINLKYDNVFTSEFPQEIGLILSVNEADNVVFVLWPKSVPINAYVYDAAAANMSDQIREDIDREILHDLIAAMK